jgi:hypothetical protein
MECVSYAVPRPLNGTFSSNLKIIDFKKLNGAAMPWRLAEKHHTAASRALTSRLQDGFQIHIADEAVEVIRVDAQEFRGLGVIAAGLIHSA